MPRLEGTIPRYLLGCNLISASPEMVAKAAIPGGRRRHCVQHSQLHARLPVSENTGHYIGSTTYQLQSRLTDSSTPRAHPTDTLLETSSVETATTLRREQRRVQSWTMAPPVSTPLPGPMPLTRTRCPYPLPCTRPGEGGSRAGPCQRTDGHPGVQINNKCSSLAHSPCKRCVLCSKRALVAPAGAGASESGAATPLGPLDRPRRAALAVAAASEAGSPSEPSPLCAIIGYVWVTSTQQYQPILYPYPKHSSHTSAGMMKW